MGAEDHAEPEQESLHAQAERQAVYVIIDAVFGLSLGLGAFSLTELPIVNTRDLFTSVGFFGFSYVIIFVSWMIIRRYFVGYTVYGSANMILFFTGFFVAVMPIPIRLILMQFLEPTSPVVLDGAFTLYSLCLSALTGTVGFLGVAFSKQSWQSAPWDDLMHVLAEGVAACALGLVFLISAFLPLEPSITDVLGPRLTALLPVGVADLPFKVGFWFLGAITIAVPALLVTRIILWRRRPRK